MKAHNIKTSFINITNDEVIFFLDEHLYETSPGKVFSHNLLQKKDYLVEKIHDDINQISLHRRIYVTPYIQNDNY